ncbi:SsgA family sporulation/cell division regulator [Streptomyces sp. NPDC002785]|uniref:SsgA family sporulation/cell division regulator n=1 Tax=Streptomyces sp. NPDC002785 TaxID=3154543 RepID=UPI00332E9C4C
MRHLPDDPLAIRMDFLVTENEPAAATWVFSRDLLATGLILPSGEGDVRVRPHGEDETDVELISGRAWCVVRMASADVRDFCGPVTCGRQVPLPDISLVGRSIREVTVQLVRLLVGMDTDAGTAPGGIEGEAAAARPDQPPGSRDGPSCIEPFRILPALAQAPAPAGRLGSSWRAGTSGRPDRES